jgi:hypothetical protein
MVPRDGGLLVDTDPPVCVSLVGVHHSAIWGRVGIETQVAAEQRWAIAEREAEPGERLPAAKDPARVPGVIEVSSWRPSCRAGDRACQRTPPSEVLQIVSWSSSRGLLARTTPSYWSKKRPGPLPPDVSPMSGRMGPHWAPPSRLTKSELRPPKRKMVLEDGASIPPK